MLKYWFNFFIIIFITCLISSPVFCDFTDTECLRSAFTAYMSHKGEPFGLTETKLEIKKEGCVITIEHQKLKWIKKRWVVDICRGPVHIKYGTGAVSVVKRTTSCQEGEKSNEFCDSFEKIKRVIQDDGLIFAEGEKENLNEDHGETFCSYLLLKAYLGDGLVFNRNAEYKQILARNTFGGYVTNVKDLRETQMKKRVERKEEIETVVEEIEKVKEEKPGDGNNINEKNANINIEEIEVEKISKKEQEKQDNNQTAYPRPAMPNYLKTVVKKRDKSVENEEVTVNHNGEMKVNIDTSKQLGSF